VEWYRRENNGGNESNPGIIYVNIIYVYMEMSQRNSLHNYHILIRMLKKNPHKVVQYNEGRVEETAF
jgi:hypothetical protein